MRTTMLIAHGGVLVTQAGYSTLQTAGASADTAARGELLQH